jgi:hypothetical protein
VLETILLDFSSGRLPNPSVQLSNLSRNNMGENDVKEAFDVSTDETESKLELGNIRVSYFIFRSNVFRVIIIETFNWFRFDRN